MWLKDHTGQRCHCPLYIPSWCVHAALKLRQTAKCLIFMSTLTHVAGRLPPANPANCTHSVLWTPFVFAWLRTCVNALGRNITTHSLTCDNARKTTFKWLNNCLYILSKTTQQHREPSQLTVFSSLSGYLLSALWEL